RRRPIRNTRRHGMSAQQLFDEWDAALAELCAGYDRPITNERRAAYRGSLGNLSLIAWKRIVEHCLSDKGPERFPTCQQLWQIHRQLRRPARAPGATENTGPVMSRWAVAANRVLMKLAYQDIRRGPMKPMGPELLPQVLAMKAEIVGYAEEAERQGNPWEGDEFIDVCKTGFEKLLLA